MLTKFNRFCDFIYIEIVTRAFPPVFATLEFRYVPFEKLFLFGQ